MSRGDERRYILEDIWAAWSRYHTDIAWEREREMERIIEMERDRGREMKESGEKEEDRRVRVERE